MMPGVGHDGVTRRRTGAEMIDWTQVLVALAAGLPATIVAAGALVTSWRNSNKTDAVGVKVDDNTKITRAVGVAAVTNAQTAATSAAAAKSATESMAQDVKKKLNGGIDAAVKEAVDPIQKILADPAATDEQITKEVNAKLERLEEYVHQRQHEVLNALQVQANRIERLIQLAEERRK